MWSSGTAEKKIPQRVYLGQVWEMCPSLRNAPLSAGFYSTCLNITGVSHHNSTSTHAGDTYDTYMRPTLYKQCLTVLGSN